ncbi:Ger(x)C family spore germination protein [Paenibacillus allorhizosphaerae]|uniref:Ger(X)C family spore germination protein n=1 Tax=Paenibacillus allorhizosphaerae TaxID=2849866 RepID=A0ABN7TGI7_9BACL|nr:Ger(x)C family spore germination protein [Paenibacillus allorhizosphaerae]CAG7631107.1 hypothetical protein PAECIP111802_01710 [Paenibacillus allorhizosphaerae]
MRKNKAMRTAALLFLTAALTVGCLHTKVLERLGLVIAAGLDLAPGDQIKGTSVLYEIDPEAKERSNVISSTAYTVKGVRMNNNVESRKMLVSGQLRVLLLHEDMAKKGLSSIVDTFTRDPDIGSVVYLAVSQQPTFDILTRRYPEISNVGEYLFQTIKQNMESEQTISSMLHEFVRDLDSPGQDASLPYIVQQKNEIRLQGAALFRGDKMAGTIPLKEVLYLRLLKKRYTTGFFELTLPQEAIVSQDRQLEKKERTYLTLDSIHSKTNINVLDSDQPSFLVKVKIKARLLEISVPVDLRNRNHIKQIEREVNKAIKSSIEKLLQKTQKLAVDPVGFGNKYRASVRHSGMTIEKWREMYPKAKFRVEVTTNLLRTGQTD